MFIQAVVTLVRNGRPVIKVIASEGGDRVHRFIEQLRHRNHASALDVYDLGCRYGLDGLTNGALRTYYGGLVVMTPDSVLTGFDELPAHYRATFAEVHTHPGSVPENAAVNQINWREPDLLDGSQLFVAVRAVDPDGELLSEPASSCEFRLGDRVTFTNDYGVSFHNRRIIGFRPDQHWLRGRTVYLNQDGWWLPSKPESLTLEERIAGSALERTIAANF